MHDAVTERARGAVRGAARGATRQMAGVRTYGLQTWIDREIDEFTADERSDNPLIAAGQAGGDVVNTMLVIVIAAVVGYVGIKAAQETNESIDTTEGTEFDNASESLTSGFTSAMDLTEVVFIVLMLSVIILALVGLRGRR